MLRLRRAVSPYIGESRKGEAVLVHIQCRRSGSRSDAVGKGARA